MYILTPRSGVNMSERTGRKLYAKPSVRPVGRIVCLVVDLKGDSRELMIESSGPDPPPTVLYIFGVRTAIDASSCTRGW